MEVVVKEKVSERVPCGARPQLAFFNMANYTKDPVEKSDRIQKIIDSRKRHTCNRNADIRKKFDLKYNVDRKRYDDVIAELADEFHLSVRTIETALKG